MQDSTAHSPARFERLDILRGVAALAVVVFHYTSRFPEYHIGGAVPFAFDYGFYGVHLFFLISGFVILMSLDRRGGEGFVRSRFIRLYPVFWASVLLTTAVLRIDAARADAPDLATVFVNLTMLPTFLKFDLIDGAYWSLAYELGFYAMMFAIFRLGWQRHIDWVPVYMAGGAVLFSFAGHYIPHPLHLLIGVNSYSHLFAGGLSLYLVHRRGWTLRDAAVLAAIPLIQFWQDGVAGLIAVGASVAVMVWASSARAKVASWTKPLIRLGGISYALYLTHQMIGYVVLVELQAAGLGPWLSFALTLGGSITLGAALTYGVERPSARWLKTNFRMPEWRRLSLAQNR